MRSLLAVTLVACAPHAAKVPVDPPAPLAVPAAAPPAPAPPPAPAMPAAPDEASIEARTHDFFGALDRFDDAAAAELVAPSFVMIDSERFMDAKQLATRARMERDRHSPARTRTWSQERVYAGPSSIVVVGHAVQHWPAEPEHPALDRDGWETVVWVPAGTSWKIALVQRAVAGMDAEKLRWNETFRIATIFKKEPNQLLVDTVKGKKPGRALDVAMGQGRNALYLAAQGWKVTGIDISDEGIRMAKAEAARRKLKLDTIEADVDSWDPGKARWDLVTMVYCGASANRVQHLQPSIQKGGLFVLEYFHADSDMAAYGAGGWKTGELAKLFGDGSWEIVRDDVVDDVSDWGLDKRKLVRFVARKK
ncbi:MAG: methyltransferase domain-containing protein [Acidobacteriota bacterium]